MRTHDQTRIITMTILAHDLDAHPVVGEGLRDGRKDTGTVGNVKIDVVPRLSLLDPPHRQIGIRRRARPGYPPMSLQ